MTHIVSVKNTNRTCTEVNAADAGAIFVSLSSSGDWVTPQQAQQPAVVRTI